MNNIELMVVGAGPAGLGAAIEARRYGVDVLLVDDKVEPGGQLFKQIHKFFGSQKHKAGTRGFDIGEDLLEEARDLGVKIHLNTQILGIMQDNNILMQVNNNKIKEIKPRNIVLATGASEKAISFPGWTLPGVMTAGAAQTMSNIERVLPGKEILMIGSGNVGLIVSYQLLQAGAEIKGIVEASSGITGYAVHAGKIMRAGVPIYTGHTIVEARGKERVEEVDIAKVDENWQYISGSKKTISVDTVCLAVGLKPNNYLSKMAGCSLKYYAELGGELPLHNEKMETNRDGIFVAGDLAGVEEANTALDEGRLAGISSAKKLGYFGEKKFKKLYQEIKRRLNNLRQGPFGLSRAETKKKVIYDCKNQEYEISSTSKKHSKKIMKKNRLRPKYLKKLPGYPDGKWINEKAVACLECGQEIPCDPCVEACPFSAIRIEGDITSLPEIDEEKCTGCGNCIAACPGQAIFVLNKTYNKDEATISFPYEYFPYPEEGDQVIAVDRNGNPVTQAKVIKVDTNKNFDKTAVITILIPEEFIDKVRFIERE